METIYEMEINKDCEREFKNIKENEDIKDLSEVVKEIIKIVNHYNKSNINNEAEININIPMKTISISLSKEELKENDLEHLIKICGEMHINDTFLDFLDLISLVNRNELLKENIEVIARSFENETISKVLDELMEVWRKVVSKYYE